MLYGKNRNIFYPRIIEYDYYEGHWMRHKQHDKKGKLVCYDRSEKYGRFEEGKYLDEINP